MGALPPYLPPARGHGLALCLGALIVALFMARPASADVLYLDPEAVPDELERTGCGTDVRRWGKTYRCFRGRILEVLPTPRGALKPRLRFEPARVTEVGDGARIEWPEPRRGYKLESFGKLEHELDGIFDLQGMFSNRDVILRAMTGHRRIRIGHEPFHTYFLLAGSVDISARLGRMENESARLFAGLLQNGTLRPLDASVLERDLREGWLVNWLRRGGPMAPGERSERLRRVYLSGRVDGTPDFARTLHGFHPLASEVLIESLGFRLLLAAAQDWRYTDAKQPDGPFGFGVESTADGPNGQTRPTPRFFSTCVDALGALCGQVVEAHPGAEAMGFQARGAVLSALAAARVGTRSATDPSESAFTPPSPEASPLRRVNVWISRARHLGARGEVEAAGQALSEARRAAKRVESAKVRQQLETRIERTASALEQARARRIAAPPAPPARLTDGLRTDPGDLAYAALRVIVRGPSWQTARFDSEVSRRVARRWARMDPAARPARPRPGERLVGALLGLAREPGSTTERRALDRVRTLRQDGVPGLPEATVLQASLVHAFDHLLADEADRDAFLTQLGAGLVDAVAGTEPPPGDAGRSAWDVGAATQTDFALRMVGRAGVVPAAIVDDLADRLFTLALTSNSGRPERDRIRQAIRRNAIASIAQLSSLGARGRANAQRTADGKDDELRTRAVDLRSYEATSRAVREKLDGLMRDILVGHGGANDVRFFDLLGVMAQGGGARLEREVPRFADRCRERLDALAAEDPARVEAIARLRARLEVR